MIPIRLVRSEGGRMELTALAALTPPVGKLTAGHFVCATSMATACPSAMESASLVPDDFFGRSLLLGDRPLPAYLWFEVVFFSPVEKHLRRVTLSSFYRLRTSSGPSSCFIVSNMLFLVESEGLASREVSASLKQSTNGHNGRSNVLRTNASQESL